MNGLTMSGYPILSPVRMHGMRPEKDRRAARLAKRRRVCLKRIQLLAIEARELCSTQPNSFGIDVSANLKQIYFMGQTDRPTCPICGAYLVLASGGNGKPAAQCFACDGPDPMKTDKTIGWLKGELRPPK